jgi:hypothetical protein
MLLVTFFGFSAESTYTGAWWSGLARTGVVSFSDDWRFGFKTVTALTLAAETF